MDCDMLKMELGQVGKELNKSNKSKYHTSYIHPKHLQCSSRF